LAFQFSIFSIPDEGYSRNMSCTLNLISTFIFTTNCNRKSSIKFYLKNSEFNKQERKNVSTSIILDIHVKNSVL